MATASVTKDAIAQVLRVLSTRMSWAVGAKVLEGTTHLYRSRGWEESINAVARTPLSQAALDRAWRHLTSTLESHVLVGEKNVTWYEWKGLTEIDRDALIAWVRRVDIRSLVSPEDRAELWTTPTQQSDLRGMAGDAPLLVRAQRAAEQLVLLFFSVRSYTTREPIDVTGFPPAQRKRFDDYLEIIGLKARCVPCFDCVIFDLKKGRHEIRMDHQVGMKSDGELASFSQIQEQLNTTIFHATTRMPMGLGVTNFFPAVDNLYQDAAAGRVEHLSFVATAEKGSSNNHGKVHRRKDQDLRIDPFHVGGKRSVSSVEPYTVGLSFESLSGYDRLLLELNGSVRMIIGGGTPKEVLRVGFHGCATLEDYELLEAVMEDHL